MTRPDQTRPTGAPGRRRVPITIAGHDEATPPLPPASDPRAVRATIARTTRMEGDATVDVAPARDPSTLLPGDAVPAATPLVDGEPAEARLRPVDDRRAVLEVGTKRTSVLFGPVHHDAGRGIDVREAIVEGWRFEIEIEPERRAVLRERARRGAAAGAAGGPVEVRAIIPGRIVAVLVSAHDTVEAGQRILVVEAMKMQNELRAPREGTVERVGVAVGDTIEVGDLLVVIG